MQMRAASERWLPVFVYDRIVKRMPMIYRKGEVNETGQIFESIPLD